MAHLPRGIDPNVLLSQVKNTMPYLFEPGFEESLMGCLPPARVLREYSESPDSPLSHFEYYRLCLCSHYLTVATPVPTDVDNQIRKKLWPAELPLATALEMANLALESRRWDFTLLSARSVRGATGSDWQSVPLTAHAGEWFTIACGAYCALGQYQGPKAPPEIAVKRQEILDAIVDEVNLESEVFGSLWRARDGLGCLKASVNIAHNFGDLDRVMDMWELGAADPLRKGFYKLAIAPFGADGKLRCLGRLWVAGELYKAPIAESAMALENHRHFALRKPKCLRQRPEFLVPLGPFFDNWGRLLAQELPRESLLEVIEALKHGWERLSKSCGYGRALRGMLEIQPDLPLDDLKKSREHRVLFETPQERFELKWANEALAAMEEIPSRAN
ncbi:MAG: hypothetical protein P4M08_04515 [Oligoflexia bacterium]|nr:hypothetical protein [Oligoflexia bacterium]